MAVAICIGKEASLGLRAWEAHKSQVLAAIEISSTRKEATCKAQKALLMQAVLEEAAETASQLVVSNGPGKLLEMVEETEAPMLKTRWITFNLQISVTNKIMIATEKVAAAVEAVVEDIPLHLRQIVKINLEVVEEVADNPLRVAAAVAVATTIAESE